MTEELMKRTFTTRTPDKPGAFMLACKVIMENGGNITRVSYKGAGHNLFIEVRGTRSQLNIIEKGLSEMTYVDLEPKEPIVLVMEVKIEDTPGRLYPVLNIIDKYDVNIIYLNSREENKDYQYFKIGMEVSDPEVSKKILDEVSEIYLLNVIQYNGNYDELDYTVDYIRLANIIQKLFSLDDSKIMEFMAECRAVSSLLKEKGQDPKVVFDKILQLANFIAYHRDLNFKPRMTQHQITEDTTLLVIEPPCGSNTYVLRNDDSLLFIDTGMGIFSDEMITELRETFPAFFSMEKRILVTHADADHCGLLSVIENAKILVNKKTADRLGSMSGPITDISDVDAYSYCYGRLSRIITDYSAPDVSMIEVIGDIAGDHADFKPMKKIEFGDIVITPYEVPTDINHGGMVFVCESPKLMFTGDLFVNKKDLIPERKGFEEIAPFLPKDDDISSTSCSKIKSMIDSIGKDGMIVCGGYGNIRRL